MKEPSISIDRQAKKWAIFDGFSCVGDFKPYTDEAAALAESKAEVAKLTDKEPEIVYPVITSMRMSHSGPRLR
jgi:hypothetical protein